MRVCEATSSRETPRRSRAAASVLPRLGSVSVPALSGSDEGEDGADQAPSVLLPAAELVSSAGLLPATISLGDLAPRSVLCPISSADLVSPSELTISSVSRAAAIPVPPPMCRTREAARRQEKLTISAQ